MKNNRNNHAILSTNIEGETELQYNNGRHWQRLEYSHLTPDEALTIIEEALRKENDLREIAAVGQLQDAKN